MKTDQTTHAVQTDLSLHLRLHEVMFVSLLCPGSFFSFLHSNAILSVTINFLNIRTPKTFVVITLKCELFGSTIV